MSNPFIVPVPRGATQIDLRPYLAPILRELLLIAQRGQPWGEAHTEIELEDWIGRVYGRDRLARAIELVQREWLSEYMLSRKWRRSGGLDGGFAQYYPPEPEMKRRGHLCIRLKEEFIPESLPLISQHWRAIHEIANWEKRAPAEVARDILAIGGLAVDALALSADL